MFNIMDYMSEESKSKALDSFAIKKIPVEKLHASETNFYTLDPEEIAELARSIELVGLQQNLVVIELENGEYEIKSGHKRTAAIKMLVDQGKEEYRQVPCKIEMAADAIKDQLIEIYTNSTQRERSDYEKMQEVKRTKQLLQELSKSTKIKGRKQELIAEMLGISKSSVGRLSNIDKNLIKPLQNIYEQGKISTSAANEIAGLPEEKQIQLYKRFRQSGELKLVEAKRVKQEKGIGEELEQAAEQEMLQAADAVVHEVEQTGDELGDMSIDVVDAKEITTRDLVQKNVKHDIEQGNTAPQGTQEEQVHSSDRNYTLRISSDYDAYTDGTKAFILTEGEKYRKGDTLELMEYADGKSTGRMIEAVVTYVQKEYTGLKDGYSILGLKVISFDVERGER